MSKCRSGLISYEIRDYAEPAVQLNKTIGVGLFGTAGFVNTTMQGGDQFTQSILNGLPIFAILQGVLDTVDGLTFVVAKRTPCVAHSNQRGYLVSKGDLSFITSPGVRYTRGILHAVSGIILAEGGFESVFNVGSTLQFLNLPWRYAIHSMFEFLTALMDLFNLPAAKIYGNNSDEIYNFYRNNVIARLIAKGLTCAGWTSIAYFGSNPFGWLCLVAASACYAYKNVPRACAFFKKTYQDYSQNGFVAAERNLAPG